MNVCFIHVLMRLNITYDRGTHLEIFYYKRNEILIYVTCYLSSARLVAHKASSSDICRNEVTKI